MTDHAGHSRILMIGSGGHAGVLIDAWAKAGDPPIHGLLDPAQKTGTILHGLPVLGDDRWLDDKSPPDLRLILGLGHMPGQTRRLTLARHFRKRGFLFSGVRHPSAIISANATLSDGVQVLAGAVINNNAFIGQDCIINSRAIIEHDVKTGAQCHIAPGAIVCGGVHLGNGVFIGAGAIILPGLRLGDGALVAAGAVATHDIDHEGRVDRC